LTRRGLQKDRDPEQPTRVLFLPDYGDANPYQRELRLGLERLGVVVSGARPPGRDPLSVVRAWVAHGRPGVLHLHWTHSYLGQRVADAESTPRGRRSAIRAALFLGQLRLLRGLGVRLVWTIHNLGHHEGARDAQEVAVHRKLVGLADAVICHCVAGVDAVTETYGLRAGDHGKLHVIPHGSYVGVYGPGVERGDARRRLSIPAETKVLVFVGAIRPYKGIHELIAAFRDVPGPDAQLIVAGRAGTRQLAQELKEAASADGRISLRLGFVPDDELPVLLGAADAVVLPFRDVLTSGSAVLAMSYGRAVVAPALGCLPEALDPNGAVLYDAQAPGALGEAIVTALASDLEAMGARNLERARRLDWGTIARATLALYRG
jgi:glycosyltransferase involved in cell wall biosynthesis